MSGWNLLSGPGTSSQELMFASYDFYPTLGVRLGILEQKKKKLIKWNKIKNKKKKKAKHCPILFKKFTNHAKPQRLGFILNIVIWESLSLGPGISALELESPI